MILESIAKLLTKQDLTEDERLEVLAWFEQMQNAPAQLNSLFSGGAARINAVSQITSNAGVFTAGKFISPSPTATSVIPTEAGFTGSFQSGSGETFGANTYNMGGVNAGVLQWGANQADGKIYAGSGAVVIDETGMTVPDVGDAIILKDLTNLRYGVISMRDITNGASGLNLLVYQVSSETNQISNGDFETGDFTSWTETDPSSKLSVVATDLGYSLKFDNSASSTGYIQQNLASSSTTGAIVTLRVKAENGGSIGVGTSGSQQVYGLSSLAGWRTVTIVLNGTVNELRIYAVTSASAVMYVDEVVIRKTSVNQEESFTLGPSNSYLNGYFSIGGVAIFNPADISGTSRFASGFQATAGLHIKGVASASLSGTYNDYSNSSIEDVSVLRITPSADVTLTGLRYSDTLSGVGSSYSGKVITIVNVGTSNTVTLKDENTGSTAEWRFSLGNGDLVIPIKGMVTLWYDGTSERWRVKNQNQLVGPVVETNANDIFRCDNPGGPSLWTGTISGSPSGTSVTVSAPVTGTEAVLVPASTSQLAKMRLYNTTRGNSALISNYNTGTNVVTLTATVPANWANGDSLTIASQTVSGTYNWVDLEITSALTGKLYLLLSGHISSSATPPNTLLFHPLETYALSKTVQIETQVADANPTVRIYGIPLKIISNVFSVAWTGTPSKIIVRESGYLE